MCVCRMYARDTMNNRKISFVKCLPEKEGERRKDEKKGKFALNSFNCEKVSFIDVYTPGMLILASFSRKVLKLVASGFNRERSYI